MTYVALFFILDVVRVFLLLNFFLVCRLLIRPVATERDDQWVFGICLDACGVFCLLVNLKQYSLWFSFRLFSTVPIAFQLQFDLLHGFSVRNKVGSAP